MSENRIVISRLEEVIFKLCRTMKLAIGLLVLMTVVAVIKASYLGYGGVYGDLTPRTGSRVFGAPTTSFRQSFPGSLYRRVRRAGPDYARPREARFQRVLSGQNGWRRSSGGGYPRTAPASSSYGRWMGINCCKVVNGIHPDFGASILLSDIHYDQFYEET